MKSAGHATPKGTAGDQGSLEVGDTGPGSENQVDPVRETVLRQPEGLQSPPIVPQTILDRLGGVNSFLHGVAGFAAGALSHGTEMLIGTPPSHERYAVIITTNWVNELGRSVKDTEELEFGSKLSAEAYASQFTEKNLNSGLEYTLEIRGPYVPPSTSAQVQYPTLPSQTSSRSSSFNARY